MSVSNSNFSIDPKRDPRLTRKNIHPRDDSDGDGLFCDIFSSVRRFRDTILIYCHSSGNYVTPKASVRVALIQPQQFSAISRNKHFKTVQEVSGVPAVQEVSGVPAVQEVSGVSGVQEVSGVPAVPGVQEASGVPGVQEVSGVPAVQEVSGVSGVQEASGVPGVPAVQEVSGVPAVQEVSGVLAVQEVSGVSGVQDVSGVHDFLIFAICVAIDNNSYDIAMLAQMVQLLIDNTSMWSFKVSPDDADADDVGVIPPITAQSYIIVYLSPMAQLTDWVTAGGVLVETLNLHEFITVDLDFCVNYELNNTTKVLLIQVGELISFANKL